MIELKNVCKTYNKNKANRVEALRNVSLCIEDGELLSIMGPSGSGKTTLLHMLALLDQPDSGEILFDGLDTAHMGDAKKARLRNADIGIVLQDYGLIGTMSALANVEIPLLIAGEKRRVARKKASEALERVSMLKRSAVKTCLLSGGERQRVAIARAIVTNAKLILADEPTGAVDSKNTDEIMELFKALNRQRKTVIIVTHNQKVAESCGRKLQIVDGQLA